jgi:DNA replication and repair protein RecF
VYIEWAELNNFRNYQAAKLHPAPEGVTLLRGGNGAGKTNLLEALAYAGLTRSFRGAPSAAVVRAGQAQALVRVAAVREGRRLLAELELNVAGRDRFRLNRQFLRRSDELAGAVLVTVFSPSDIDLVKGPPQGRRDLLDDLAGALHPEHRWACSELERVLRQRNALLRSAGEVLRGRIVASLDAWDEKLASVGEEVAAGRESVVQALGPEVRAAYGCLSRGAEVELRYLRSWEGALREALVAARAEDLRRGLTTAGPQRDELAISLGQLPARDRASQGEQRSVALALRLGGHCLLRARHGTSPVLMLDDIFSELDEARGQALAASLPEGQLLLTTATEGPRGLAIAKCIEVTADVAL